MAANSAASFVPPVPPVGEPDPPDPDVGPLPDPGELDPLAGVVELPPAGAGVILVDVAFDDCVPPQPAVRATSKHTENKAIDSWRRGDIWNSR